MKRQNEFVPIETLFRHQSRELAKLRLDNEDKKRTIKRLQRNIDLILGDPEVKIEVAKENRVRQYKQQIASAHKELNRVRKSERKILETLLKYKLKENEQSTRSN